MRHRTILITGGAGFIGSNLALSFRRAYPGLKIICLDNLKRRGSEMNINRLKEHNIRFVHGDIRCPEDLVLRTPVDLLIECSAEPSVLAGFGDNPAYIINTNLAGTVNCLELARRHKADVIFLSTSRVYPYGAVNAIKAIEGKTRFDWAPHSRVQGWTKEGLREDFTIDGPKTLYGATKMASELILREYAENYGLKCVINRCGVIAGPWQFGKVDQGVFTLWMLAHYFKKRLRYIGFQGKGKQVRDLLHVDDLFDLIKRQISLLPKISGRVYNVGGGRGISLSLLEATRLCEEITGNRITIDRVAAGRPGDIKIYLGDNRKVCRELGWRPEKKTTEILGDIYQWICENESGLKAII